MESQTAFHSKSTTNSSLEVLFISIITGSNIFNVVPSFHK